MIVVAGVHITDPSEVHALVRRQLTGGGVWCDKNDVTELDGIWRATRSAGPLVSAFAAAIMRLLEHDSLTVRTGAAACLPDVRNEIDPDALATLLERRPELFEGVRARKYRIGPHRDLAGPIHAALSAQVQTLETASPLVVGVLRRGARAGRSVLGGLACVDSEWLLTHASEVVPRSHIGGVLQCLSAAVDRRRLLEALSPWPRDEAEAQLSHTYWRYLPPDEVPGLREILSA